MLFVIAVMGAFPVEATVELPSCLRRVALFWQGEEVTAVPELAFLNLAAGTRVFHLGSGGEGHVYRILPPDGTAYVIKIFDIAYYRGDTGDQAYRDNRTVLKSTARSLRAAAAAVAGCEDCLRVVHVQEAIPRHLALRLENLRGYDLVSLDELVRGSAGDELASIRDAWNRRVDATSAAFRRAGWDILPYESRGGLPGFRQFIARRGDHSVAIHPKNVIFDLETGEMTISDPK